MELLQERYSTEALIALIEQGTAKPFHLSPQAGEIAEVLNTAYTDRVDIGKQLEIDGVPVKIHILVDKTDGVPWSWAFTLNLSRAEQNGRVIDTKKIKELSRQFSVFEKHISVGSFRHPFWTNGQDELYINALNLPPGNVVRFFNAVFSEAIR